jgi:hypothetical protein
LSSNCELMLELICPVKWSTSSNPIDISSSMVTYVILKLYFLEEFSLKFDKNLMGQETQDTY